MGVFWRIFRTEFRLKTIEPNSRTRSFCCTIVKSLEPKGSNLSPLKIYYSMSRYQVGMEAYFRGGYVINRPPIKKTQFSAFKVNSGHQNERKFDSNCTVFPFNLRCMKNKEFITPGMLTESWVMELAFRKTRNLPQIDRMCLSELSCMAVLIIELVYQKYCP